MTDSSSSKDPLQYLSTCADLAEALGEDQDGLAYVSPRKLREAIAEIKRLDADAANEKAEKESLAAIVRTRDEEIERLKRIESRLDAAICLHLPIDPDGPGDCTDRLVAAVEAAGEEHRRLRAALDEADAPRQEAADRAGPEVSRQSPESQCDTIGGCPELKQLRRIDQAARAFVNAVPESMTFAAGQRAFAALCDALFDPDSVDPLASKDHDLAKSRSVQRRVAAQRVEPASEFGPTMHEGGTPLTKIADKLDTAEDLTDCERGCAADALRRLADSDVRHIRLRQYRMPARELPDDGEADD